MLASDCLPKRVLVVAVIAGLLLAAAPAAIADYRVIWDDDGDPSGVLGLLLFLAHPEFDVAAASVCVGEAVPGPYASRLAMVLERLGHDIPVTYGSPVPTFGDHVFPEPWRKGVTSFFNLDLCDLIDCPAPLSHNIYPEPDAGRLIADALVALGQSNAEMVLFASGPLTNVFAAYTLWRQQMTQSEIQDIADTRLHLEIMGGAVNVPGNLDDWGAWTPPNDTAEWNLWIDPLAASAVFSGPAHVYMSALDVTNEVLWDHDDVQTLRSFGTCLADFAATLLESLIGTMGGQSAHAWDLTAAAMTAIRLAEDGIVSLANQIWVQGVDSYCIRVDTWPPDEGWTEPCAGPINASAYRIDTPNQAELVKEYILSIFAQAGP